MATEIFTGCETPPRLPHSIAARPRPASVQKLTPQMPGGTAAAHSQKLLTAKIPKNAAKYAKES